MLSSELYAQFKLERYKSALNYFLCTWTVSTVNSVLAENFSTAFQKTRAKKFLSEKEEDWDKLQEACPWLTNLLWGLSLAKSSENA